VRRVARITAISRINNQVCLHHPLPPKVRSRTRPSMSGINLQVNRWPSMLPATGARIPPPLRRKSCAACIKAKRRCTLQQPRCGRCTQRNIRCRYPGSVPAQVDTTLALPNGPEPTVSAPHSDAGTRNNWFAGQSELPVTTAAVPASVPTETYRPILPVGEDLFQGIMPSVL